MFRCSFAKTFWILLCREVKAQKLIHDTNSMFFSQPRFYPDFALSCVWNSAMFPIMFYKLLNAISTVFVFFRSSLPEVFCKKSVHRNFAKFTEKRLCQSLFFDKIAGFRPSILLKKCLFVLSHTLHVTLFTTTSTLFRSSFLFLILYLGALFYKKRKKEKNIENQKKKKKIWKIVVLTDRCKIKKWLAKKM